MKEREKGFKTNNEKTEDSLEIAVNEIFFLEDISNGSGLKINTESEDKNDD